MSQTSRKVKTSRKVTQLSVPQIDKKLSDIALICTFEKVKPFLRTAGDGMEQERESEYQESMSTKDTDDIPQQVKRREPRFVPYEPYRATVTPICPLSESESKASTVSTTFKETHIPFPLADGTDVELFEKSQVPLMKVLRDAKVPDLCQSKNAIIIDANVYQAEKDSWRAEKMKLEEDIRELKNSKHDLENQFKIQTQVNKELKKLLVASMGEDMQSRVQFLSEDKARLAQDIFRYSQKLLEDNEELERRAILCDVWRSKFLACSLMVDELAGWKARLYRNFEESKEVISWLLKEHSEFKQQQLLVHRYLKQLHSLSDPTSSKNTKSFSQTSSNLLQLSQQNRQLAEAVHFRLLASSSPGSTFGSDSWICDHYTPAEELAQKVLSSKDVCLENLSALDSNENCSRHKLFRFHSHNEQLTMNCCRHCLGEINVV